MNSPNIIISWCFWVGLMILTQLGFVWAENLAVFTLWFLAVLSCIVLFTMPRTLRVGGEKVVELSVPFSRYSYIVMSAVALFFAMRGQFGAAGAGAAIVLFMSGIDNVTETWKKTPITKSAGERGH